MNPEEVYVFVVDSDPAMRAALERTLKDAGIHASVFSGAQDCLAALSEQPCDVILTDLRLDGRNDLSLAREVRRRFPWLHIIIVTAYGDVPLAVAAMKAGATDFLEKPVDREELLSAIREAGKDGTGSVPFPREALSEAEAQVLRLLLNGHTSREIGVALNRSTRTIEVHRHCLMRKFGVRNAAQLARKASALWLSE